MSIPIDLLDQLLTGYLDDALSPDERARVETLIKSDTKVADELAELRELQSSLRTIAESDASIQLDSGFADRVLNAAVDRARTEGLGQDHPLIRLTDQRSVPRVPNDGARPFRSAALLVGLAASIAVAVITLRLDLTDDSQPLGIANVDADQDLSRVDQVAKSTLPGPIDKELTDTPTESIAVIEPTSEPERVAEIASEADREPPSLTTEPKAAKAMLDTKIAHSSAAVTAKQIDIQATQIGAILVLDVRMTAAGHMENAVLASMHRAGLKEANQKELPKELAEQFTGTNGDADNATVIYLQASAKTLDRLYLSLLGDQVGIESVGMSLAMNAPILKIVQSLATDPTTVQHDKTALELSGVAGFAGELSRLDFAPMNSQTAGAMSPSGPDVPAQILLLVR